MKIGIVTSSNDMLTLFKFLTKYDHEYVVYYDQSHQFYGDQTFEESLLNVQSGIDCLTKEGVDYIILPPLYELAILCHSEPCLPAGRGNEESKKNNKKLISFVNAQDDIKNKILPLFQEYIMKECFAYSLVGKIGLLGDFADLQVAEKLLHDLGSTYKITDTQKSIRKFHFPFSRWAKEVPLRKYFLAKFSFSSMMVNRVVKEDLKYFKDAMVDTLIPLNYGYFNYQNTITKFLNFKKIRFHKLEKIENCFQQLAEGLKFKAGSYGVKIMYTGHMDFLQREKKWMRLLQRGKNISVERLKVESGEVVKKISKTKK
ncbi:MAG: hypothetical protein NTX91_00835 [candidate division SR1 bacterium]|nr:hypothetical protein [candidate division SR1 bacterium]